MALTPAERKRRQRLREAGLLAPLRCEGCGGPHRGRHGGICRRCWERLTPDGRRDRADRVARAKRAKKQRDNM